ncbi:hypothetical protein V493_04220 [Pseudogymnoascus sp. VKM F-4281 (FW-2241)]|nr:hypothetical protein V493_04220 [Pseudogymnoascus sp. VKM F-4281 (FW-2241)]
MSTPGAPPAQGAGRGGRSRHYRRPRRGGAQNGTAPVPGAPRDTPAQPAQGNAAAVPPAPVAPQTAPGSNPNPNPNRRNNGQSNRGRGGRPGQRGGGAPRHVMGGAGGRAFGGQLTSAGGASGSSAPLSLHAEAPAFTPGQSVVPRSGATHNHPPPNIGRQRRFSKSQAADIATRTHEDILHGLYECPICTSEVLKNSKVWSCKTCWTVFHLSCVKKWAKNEGSTQQNRQQLQDGELPPARQWRCPGCNLPKDDMPDSYTCWCAKDVDPKAIPGLPPHSCGQTCGKPRAPRNCPHPCDLMCHAGPCPPCPHMGPIQACFCGKDEVSKRCIDTYYDSGWSCGKKCGDMMPCGEHECEKGCHEGLCGSCEVLVESRCYCGKVEKMVPCSDRGDEKDSSIVKEDNEVDSWTGSFEYSRRTALSIVARCHHPLPLWKEYFARPGFWPVDMNASRNVTKESACPVSRSCLSFADVGERRRQLSVIKHLKQEVRCLATKAAPVTERKTLACDDECLRLQRNAKLAAALNIPSDHTDDHIPYSTATLDYFKGSPKWCQTQEREFRVFAADITVKQFRFKPMSAAQRAFLHSLAEDFALDTESVDPEPHRHVVLFKAPRFVSAPMKTLSQCLKLRPVVEAAKNAPATTGVPFNALLLANPRFALTLDDLRAAFSSDPAIAHLAGWKIEFLPSEEIVIRGSLADGVDEATLLRLKPAVTKIVLEKELAGAVALCAVDASLNVTRREDTGAGGGWSQVVKGAPVKKRVVDEWAASGKNSFTVLGSKAAGKKKEKEKGKERERQESVVENWEDAVGAWEDSVEGASAVEVSGEVDESKAAGASVAEEAPEQTSD